jgi:phage FluMu protein Com
MGVKLTSDFGVKCEKCETINTITLEEGERRDYFNSQMYSGSFTSDVLL